jgi:hypothetical protein
LAKDPEFFQLIDKLENKESVTEFSLFKGCLHCRSRFDLKQNVAMPAEAVPMLFDYYHSSPLCGHLGVFKTISKIREIFIWKSVDNDKRAGAVVVPCVA